MYKVNFTQITAYSLSTGICTIVRHAITVCPSSQLSILTNCCNWLTTLLSNKVIYLSAFYLFVCTHLLHVLRIIRCILLNRIKFINIQPSRRDLPYRSYPNKFVDTSIIDRNLIELQKNLSKIPI